MGKLNHEHCISCKTLTYDVGEQGGAGFLEKIRSLFSKGQAIASKVVDAATGDIGTAISNLVPSSDANARPLYSGEKHALLKLDDGKYGRANYVGPSTHLVERLKRNDPPRTQTDKEAMAHDSRYALAHNYGDVRKADEKMIEVMKRLRANKLDSNFNTSQGLHLIQAKTKLEDMGLPNNAFATFGGIEAKDRPLVQSTLDKLEQDGFGKKAKAPSHRLKMKLIANVRRQKKKEYEGSGVVTDLLESLSSKGSKMLLPYIMKYFQNGYKSHKRA
jgi:hypothetical protein